MTAAGQALARAHQLAQIDNGGLAAAMVLELGRQYHGGQLSRDEFIAALLAQGRLSHEVATRLALAFITEYRKLEDPDGDPAAPLGLDYDQGATLGRAVGTVKDLETLESDTRDYDTAFWRIIEDLAGRQHREALNAGRDAVIVSAEANGKRWRRVTDGNPCAFCAMLATRSDYTSAFAAQYVVGRGRTTKLGARGRRGLGVRPRGKRQLGEKFHDRCGCTVTEVLSDWEPNAAERRQQDLYRAAIEACNEAGIPANTKNVLSKMRELDKGALHDSQPPKTQTGGAGGGRKPPRRGAGPFKDMPEPPRDPEQGGDRSEWLRYWKERQDALPLDFKGDIVESHEVMLYERLLRLGEQVTPIARHATDPRNDMHWERIGLPVENKSAKAKYTTIRQRVYEAVRSARAHPSAPLAKEIFLVDIGLEPLSQELKAELAQYNNDRSRFRIKRLFVMHSDGAEITEIALE